MYSDLIAIEITEQLAVDLNLSVCNRLRNKTKKNRLQLTEWLNCFDKRSAEKDYSVPFPNDVHQVK